MTWVKLTRADDSVIWINSERVDAIKVDERGLTKLIYMADDEVEPGSFSVKETPEEILAMIGASFAKAVGG